LREHFDNYLNLRQIILDKKPEVIVECGAGNGDLTRLIAHMQWLYPFDFKVISDKEIDFIDEVEWITGISYEAIKSLADDSVDLCIIDTDHNYWTLRQELEALIPKMREGGLVVMHDVEEFYYDTGMGMSYWNGAYYPEKEIKEMTRLGGTGLALIDFIHDFRGTFKLVRFIPESHGAAVIEKRTVNGTSIITPGPDAVFAKPEIKGEKEHATANS
jgi:hypothetical protein